MSSESARPSESFRPSPERIWIRYRPRGWPAATGDWVDWAHRGLGRRGRLGARLPESSQRPLSDVLYLPPVAPELEHARLELAASWRASGTPLVVQLRAGIDAEEPKGAIAVWDLLPALLGHDLRSLGSLPAGGRAVWPLIAGMTDGNEIVGEGLERLRDAGVAAVQAFTLELAPPVRRRLSESGDARTFDRLFHGDAPSERTFARRASTLGLQPFLARPLPPEPPRLRLRRRCAGELRLAAELMRRLELPEVEGQKLLRAARWIDREDHDLAALVEDGNLAIVDWLDDRSARMVEEVVRSGGSEVLSKLLDEYAGSTS